MNNDELRVLRAVELLGEDATEPAVWVQVNSSLLEGGELAGGRVAALLDWLRACNHLGNRITTTIQGRGEYTVSVYFLTLSGMEWLRTGIEPEDGEPDFVTDLSAILEEREAERVLRNGACSKCGTGLEAWTTGCPYCGHFDG